MKTVFTKAFFVAIFLIGFFSMNAQTFDPVWQDGRVYVKFKDNIDPNIEVNPDRSVNIENAYFVHDLLQDYDISAVSRPFDLNNDSKLLRTFMIEFSQFEKIDEIMERLNLNVEFEYVEKVPYNTIDHVPNDSLYNLVNGPANWKWHLDVVGAEMAWDVTMGSADVKLAIVDNAVWVDHPDLSDKIVAQRDTYYNTNSANPPSSGDPGSWSHGTHCAGLAAGMTDNEVGIASLGANTSIIAVKAANNSNPNGIYGYPGIQWAANNGADIISMSWGGTGYSQTNQNMINTIHNMGIVQMASAGNDNVNSPHYPSAYNHIISTASSDYDDGKSSFSNYGYTIDITAPGGFCTPGPSGLLSTTYDNTSMGYYDSYYGTSMATPFAAGLASMILAINPELSPDDVEQILKDNCVDIDPVNPGYEGDLGAGRIDAYASVINTPFEPTAMFETGVTTILPGTSIDFTDLSTGIPSDWDWNFSGGVPTTSNDPNPEGIEYPSAGTYDVELTVTNAWGTHTLVLEDYVEVTSNPKPYVVFEASSNDACVGSAVTFTDMSLYDPTSWEWTFEPGTVTFANGTSASSQNPDVEFNAPGDYNVTLTATNANGSRSLTKEAYVFAEGIQLPFEDDFEAGETTNFRLYATEKGNIRLDKRGAAPGSGFGIHFHGSTTIGGWSGGGTNTSPEQAWETNAAFHTFAENCHVDATGVTGIELAFDLRQTYSLGPLTSWFRVLIDGVPVSDVYGVENFNPETNEDEWERKIFYLDDYANSSFTLTFQASCYLSNYFFAEGDNAMLDNIEITDVTSIKEVNNNGGILVVYPNPANENLNVSVTGVEGTANLTISNIQGQVVYAKALTDVTAKNSVGISDLPAGLYIVKVYNNEFQINKKVMIK